MMNWRVIVAVVVALLVGVGAGALGEHQRLKDKSNKKSASSTTKKTTPTTKKHTTTKAPTADFFGSKTTQACPALKDWNASTVAAYQALTAKKAWATERPVVLAQIDVASTAYRKLESFATAGGKTELALLLAYQVQARAAVLKATSSGTYFEAQSKLTTPRINSAVSAVVSSVKHCSTA